MSEDKAVHLLPCPFCGQSHTLVTITAQELAEQDSDYDGEFWEHSESWAVICDASRPDGPGGCGANGGFKPTKDEAIEVWNRRAALDSKPATEQAEPLSMLFSRRKALAEKHGFMMSAAFNALIRDVVEWATQPARAQLTEKQMREERNRIDPDGEDVDAWSFGQGVRFAERAHGIGEAGNG